MNLLDSVNYDPSTADTYSTASATVMAALDTTNLRLTVVVPAHGKLYFRLAVTGAGSGNPIGLFLGVMVGATVKKRVTAIAGNARAGMVSQDMIRYHAEFAVDGLAAGSTAFDFAYAVERPQASSELRIGGADDTTQDNAYGAPIFEIWDPQPLPTAAPGAANGVLIAGANVGDTSFTASSANTPGLTATGTGTAAGVRAVGGATGNGIYAKGNGTAGAYFTGDGGGAGLQLVGSAADPGLVVSGGSTNGTPGATITTSSTTGDALQLNGQGTGHGLHAKSGSGATGNGIQSTALSTNGNGMSLTGNGTGNGMLATGGAGAGGDGIEAAAGGGVGINGITAPPSAAAIADQVWDEALAGHVSAGSTGAALNTAASLTVPTAAAIADQVWDEATSGHLVAGSFGELQALMFGLSNGMVVIDNTTNTSNGLTAARIRVFTSAGDVAAATDGGSGEGEIATFQVTSTFVAAGQLDVFRARRLP